MRRASIVLGIFLAVAVGSPAYAAAPGHAEHHGGHAQATQYSTAQGNYIIHDFKFEDGQTLPALRLHYRTLGRPRTNAQGRTVNAVYIMHGTTGSGAQFLRPEFAGVLFGPGQLLDTTKYFIILPDGIGHGQSSKPSDGLHARFPHYGYRDMIRADHTMLTRGLHVNHLRLVMGTSMGGMHTWLWGEMYPNFMDALMPLASLPVQISGRNRWWRKLLIEDIKDDPSWDGGNYTTQPRGLRLAAGWLLFMLSNPRLRYLQAPTLAKADSVLKQYQDNYVRTHDANDVMYAFAASWDYNPAPDLYKIKAPLIAVNTADDLINPPDMGILQKEIKHVKHGRAVVIPEGPETVGHSTHTKAVVWKKYLAELLQESAH